MAQTRKRATKEEASPTSTTPTKTSADPKYEIVNSYTVRDKAWPETERQKFEYAELKKPAHASEFGGVIGTPFLTFALPVVIYWIWASIEFNNGYLLRPQVSGDVVILHMHVFFLTFVFLQSPRRLPWMESALSF